MDTSDVIAMIAVGISAFAFLLSIGAVVYARRQTLAAEEQNRIAAEELRILKEAKEKYVIPWRFEWDKGDTYRLINDSDNFEYDVKIEPPENVLLNMLSTSDVVEPRTSVVFMAGFTMASSGRYMEVTWSREPGGERLSWSDWVPHRS